MHGQNLGFESLRKKKCQNLKNKKNIICVKHEKKSCTIQEVVAWYNHNKLNNKKQKDMINLKYVTSIKQLKLKICVRLQGYLFLSKLYSCSKKLDMYCYDTFVINTI